MPVPARISPGRRPTRRAPPATRSGKRAADGQRPGSRLSSPGVHDARLERMRILLAEDDGVLADGLSRSLRAGGYAVDAVSSGTDADVALVAQSYDLLILDLGLPKMPGQEVLRRMRSRNDSVPVLILTAADSVEQRVHGLDLGADDYMAKPFALS